ncbi:hypothetical protein EW145_g4058 [Phellinidium pouzarii]|uniref:FAD-binding PCMH-type domain-containing protein n=1 Tax=Phellinidium pouzarii TaxID=167371 RepID=A0A4S4L550_9AGAM|nr:hypothetical protein EW145_g4058 [Phellinidium pouzarii]
MMLRSPQHCAHSSATLISSAQGSCAAAAAAAAVAYEMSYLRVVRAAALAAVSLSLNGVHAASIASISQSTWNSLNKTVGGRLFAAVPFSRPCFQDAVGMVGAFDNTACNAIEENYTNKTFRRNIFGSYMNTEWETCQMTSSQCLLDSNEPTDPLAFTPPRTCNQGSVPSFYIDVNNPNDVAAGFAFSEKTGIPLVVKNTGHDYKGRSSGPNSLALFMHNLQSLTLDKNFKPTGCKNCAGQSAVTMGAGTTFLNLYEFADANNITVPGGADPTVGAAGGYLMGGGHSALSNVFGLFVDRLLEVEVVVPSGQVLIANDHQNTDLFFAIRGGGGGTFGVVISVTTKAFPRMTLPAFKITADILGTSVAAQKTWLTFISSKVVALSKTGWGGYVMPNSGLVYTNPLLNDTAATAEIQEVLDFAVSKFNATVEHIVEQSYLQFYLDFIAPTTVPVGLPFAVTSRLIPVANFATSKSQAELVDAMLPSLTSVPLPILFQVTPLWFTASGADTSGTSVTPAWRNSMWHLTASTSWNFNTTLDERIQIFKNLTANMDILRKATPGGGAYQNEADVYEPDFQRKEFLPATTSICLRDCFIRIILGLKLQQTSSNQEQVRPEAHSRLLAMCWL